MRLNLETIQTLLNSVKGKSADTVFSVLSTQLKLPIKYTSSMTTDERKKCYRLMTMQLHPDKVEDGAQEKAKELFQLLGVAYAAFSSSNSTSLDTIDIDDPINKLWEFIATREFMDNPWRCTDESSLDFLAIFIPTQPDSLANVTEKNWQDASKSLDDLLNKITQNEQTPISQTILNNRENIRLFYQAAKQHFNAKDAYIKNPTKAGFIKNVVLPSIAKAASARRSKFNSFPFHSKESYDYDVPINIVLCQILSIGFYKNKTLTDPFLANTSLADRKKLYFSIKKQILQNIEQDKNVYQYCMEIVFAIKEYQEHYAGFLGTIRRYYRQLFDNETWVAEQQQLETIERTTLKTVIDVLKNANYFSPTPPSAAEIDAFKINPTINADASPFLFALIQRVTEFHTAYRIRSSANYEEIYQAYNDVRTDNPAASERPNISKEMGVLGLFGTFGATKPRQRYLHTLKTKLLDKLVAEAEQAPENTITVPLDTLTIIKQHNSRFWRIGPTASETRFEQLFVKQEDDTEATQYKLKPYPLMQ